MASLQDIRRFCDDMPAKGSFKKKPKKNFRYIGLALGAALIAFLLGSCLVIPILNRKTGSYDTDTLLQDIINNSLGEEAFTNNNSLGYEFLENDTIIHAWNSYDSYYFNASNGVQFTNHYNEYWAHNTLMLGYYAGDTWNLLYRVDNLNNFERDFEGVTDSFMNWTLYKDLSYNDYDFRLGLCYHLKPFDNNLTIIPFITNLGVNIPFDIGFAWELNNIKINNVYENNFFIAQTYDPEYNISWNLHDSHDDNSNKINNSIFFIRDNITKRQLYLNWNGSLDYLLQVKSRQGEYNAPVTLFINAGSLNAGATKSTRLFWYDASTLDQYCYGTDYDFAIYGSRWGYQSFIPTMNTLDKVILNLKKSNSPSGSVYVEIFDNPDTDEASALASVSMSTSNIGTSYAEKTFNFDPDLTVTTGNTYYIVIRAPSGTATGSNYVQWNFGGNDYSDGLFAYSSNSGSTWTTYSQYDTWFETYGEDITPPSDSWKPAYYWSFDYSNTSSFNQAYYWSFDYSNTSSFNNEYYWNFDYSNTASNKQGFYWSFDYGNTSTFNQGFYWSFDYSYLNKSRSAYYWNVGYSNSTPVTYIIISGIYPSNNSVNIIPQPNVYATFNQIEGEEMNVSIYYGPSLNTTNTLLENFSNINNGTQTALMFTASSRSTNYYWRINVNDGETETNATLTFKTEYEDAAGFYPVSNNSYALVGLLGLIGLLALLWRKKRKGDEDEEGGY
ncbi:MAG: LPXTG cell wall anchor domain-containing protein [Candidatus Omnitrophica bacterium]|nr:LPXTG cell wall anchor domain-containing protein [Candidatus Omnitrophota bacterium]